MAFQEIANSETTDANKVLENFYKIGRGSRLPYGSNSTLDPTTGVFSLGGTATVGGSVGVYYWNKLYVDNIDMTGEIDRVWYRLTSSTLIATAASFTFSNLNGDTDIDYMIIAYIKYTPNTASNYGLYFNSDTGTNYGYQNVVGRGGVVSAGRSNTTSIEFGVMLANTTAANVVYAKNYVHAKTGSFRTMISDAECGAGESYVDQMRYTGGIWSNTASTVTAMTIYSIQTTGGIEPDSYFELWVRR